MEFYPDIRARFHILRNHLPSELKEIVSNDLHEAKTSIQPV